MKIDTRKAAITGMLRAFLIAVGILVAPMAASAAEVLKVLGQLNPSATTATTLYTVPASTSAVVSTITVTNQGAGGSFRIAVRPAGATLAALHYIAYDIAIPANESITLTLGLTLATTDVVTVYASSGTMSFSIFGSELS